MASQDDSKKAPSKPTLYYVWESPPSVTVLVTARLANIDLELKTVDMGAGEHHQEHYVKINPFRTVPTLVDEDGFVLHESRSIAAYLLQTHRPDSRLYPQNDLKRRITVDRFLHYELGTLFPAISDVIYPVYETGSLDLTRLPKLHKVLKVFNDYLVSVGDQALITGDAQLSLADISAYLHWRLFDLIPELDVSEYTAIKGWAERVRAELAPTCQELLDKSEQALRAFGDEIRAKAKEEAEQTTIGSNA